jgi:hypothetical protein
MLKPATRECSRYVKSKIGSTPALGKIVAATECGRLLEASQRQEIGSAEEITRRTRFTDTNQMLRMAKALLNARSQETLKRARPRIDTMRIPTDRRLRA